MGTVELILGKDIDDFGFVGVTGDGRIIDWEVIEGGDASIHGFVTSISRPVDRS